MAIASSTTSQKRLNVTELIKITGHIALIGIGATLILDLWGLFQSRVLKMRGLDYAMIGRWIGHMPRGRFRHPSILQADSIPGERAMGWIVHYLTGILFAGGLVLFCGVNWLFEPTFLPAIITGVITVAAPFLIMQPSLGFGLAASKTPRPSISRLRSLVTHSVFGLGLYLTATAIAVI